MPLVICPSCREHVRQNDVDCPHCGASVRTVTAPGPALVLLGLALAGCPADDYREDLPADSTSTTTATTSTTTVTETSESGTGTGTSTTDVGTSLASEAAYGLPETESFTESTTSDTSGTSDSGDTTGTTDGSSSGDSTGSTGNR